MDRPVRVTKRRGQTRARMLEAAFEVFSEQGFGRATIEQICDHAGYTRGAFYSNFASLDELFLAIWSERSDQMITAIADVLEARAQAPAVELRESICAMVDAVPVDERWYRISTEFTVHALRDPVLRSVVAAREERIAATLMPYFEVGINRAGRTITDRSSLAAALVAVHDGTSTQCVLEPGDARAQQRRADLFVHVVMAYTTAVEPQ